MLTESESPDHKFRCLIYGGHSSLLMGNKWTYSFEIKSRDTYARLKEGEFEYLPGYELFEKDVQFKWSGQQVEVTIEHAGAAVVKVVGDFDGREQRWRRIQ